MQAQSIFEGIDLYDEEMKAGRPSKSQRTDFAQRLHDLREAAGLTQKEVADQLGIRQPSYALWEQHNVALKPEQIVKIAHILKVSVEHLLGEDQPASRKGGPVGKARKLFEETSKLPRSQQQKIAEVVEALIGRHKQIT